MNMIRNIWGIGRNYSEHARELGNQVPAEPLVFLKAGSCATFGNTIQLPDWCKLVDHELELALMFDEQLQFDKWALALDLTERNQQARLKSQGLPWTLAKSFTGSCPLSDFFPIGSHSFSEGVIQLEVNGVPKQIGQLNQMIFPIETLRKFVTSHFPVVPGDVIVTGTPSGVGPISRGDELRGMILDRDWNWTVR